jgi:hypothetical protein
VTRPISPETRRKRFVAGTNLLINVVRAVERGEYKPTEAEWVLLRFLRHVIRDANEPLIVR